MGYKTGNNRFTPGVGVELQMKIILVSGIYPPDVGGPATFVPQLAAAFSSRGNKVKVLTLSDVVFKNEKPEMIPLIRLPRKLPLPIRFALTVSVVASYSIIGYRIFANGLHEECGIALFLTGGKGVAKIVGDPVWERAVNRASTNLGIQEFNKSSLNWKNWLQRRLLTFSLNRFNSVITPSEELVSLVKNWDVKPNVIWIPNGVTIKQEVNVVKSIDVITVSRLVAWKNVEVLVSAAKEYGFSLYVVGDGPEIDKLATLSEGNKNIALMGRLMQSEIDDLLLRSRIFALISEYEGLSFSLLQAMSFGLPVVVSNTSGNSSVVSKSKNGLIVNSKSSQEVGAALLSLLSDKDKLNSFSQNSRLSVEESFSINVCLEKTIREVIAA